MFAAYFFPGSVTPGGRISGAGSEEEEEDGRKRRQILHVASIRITSAERLDFC